MKNVPVYRELRFSDFDVRYAQLGAFFAGMPIVNDGHLSCFELWVLATPQQMMQFKEPPVGILSPVPFWIPSSGRFHILN